MLRISPLILLAGPDSDHAEAETCLVWSLEYARRQSTASWQLRTATALARCRVQRGAFEHARQSLAAVHKLFTEGYGIAALEAAKELIVVMPFK